MNSPCHKHFEVYINEGPQRRRAEGEWGRQPLYQDCRPSPGPTVPYRVPHQPASRTWVQGALGWWTGEQCVDPKSGLSPDSLAWAQPAALGSSPSTEPAATTFWGSPKAGAILGRAWHSLNSGEQPLLPESLLQKLCFGSPQDYKKASLQERETEA